MKTKKVYAKQLDCDDTTIYCDDDAIFDNVCVVLYMIKDRHTYTVTKYDYEVK